MDTTLHVIDPVDAAERLGVLLPADEAARVARFRHKADRDSFSAAHALKRFVLARELGVGWRDLVFEEEDHGKPVLAGRPLGFNLSHCRSMAVVAVSGQPDVGVDVEVLSRRVPDVVRKSGAVFDADERRGMARLSQDELDRQFLRTFVLKEAVVKATGLGLPQGLAGFGVVTDPPAIARADVHLGDPATWTLSLHEVDAHLVGLAVRLPGVRAEVVRHSADDLLAARRGARV